MIQEDIDGFTEVAMGTDGARAAFGNTPPPEHGLFAQFYIHPMLDEVSSAEQGRPIYKDKEYIRIKVVGDKTSLVERPVRFGYQQKCDNIRFAREYEAFKQNKEQKIEGTPLAQWPPISKGQIHELEHFGVKSVEQLSAMSDTHVQGFRGVLALRNLARRYIEHAQGMAPMTKMQEELNAANDITSAQTNQLNAMAAELAALKGERANTVQPVMAATKPHVSAPAITTPDAEIDDADDMYATPPVQLVSEAKDAPEPEQPAEKKAKVKRRKIAE